MVNKKHTWQDIKKDAGKRNSNDNVIDNNPKAGRHSVKDNHTEQHQEEGETGSVAATPSASNEELQEKLAEMQDRYLRLSAEFDNYRKRTLKEKIELSKTASETVLLRLLPVIDDFERGMKVMETASDCGAMKEGITLIYSKFQAFLDQNGVKEIDALNKEFNVDMHEAVIKVPSPEEKMRGTVLDVIEKGYLLTDKVIRFSKVVVGE